jgi:hypothetical protein
MRREVKIEINDKQVVIRELAIEDILGLWEKISSLEKGQTLMEEVGKIAIFANEILPKVTDLDRKILLTQGFSVIRKIWKAFLEVNEDFLWILDSCGITTAFKMVKEESQKEAREFLRKIIESIRSDMKASTENTTPTPDEKSKEELPLLTARAL